MTAATSVAPGWLSQALEWVGLRWPDGDPDALTAAGDAWLALGRALGEQHDRASALSRQVWSAPNGGELADAFRVWWTARTGPGANLPRAAGAAVKIGTALRGLAVQITALRAVYVAQLGLLAFALGAAGLLIVGTAGAGTVLVAAGGSAAVTLVRQALVRRLRQAIAAVGALLVVALLRKAADELVLAPAPTTTTTDPDEDRRTRPEPGPRPPGPFPIPWRDDEEPRCRMHPDLFLPREPPILVGAPDPRTRGGHIIRIERHLDGTARVNTIDGVMSDPSHAARLGRPQYELRIARESIGLPPGAYHACHVYGPGFGSEAAAGMALCPAPVNTSGGAMWDIEQRLRTLNQGARADGGWVELSVQSRTFQTSAWPDPLSAAQLPSPQNQPAGANLLHRVDYTATVCRENSVVDRYDFGLEIAPPRLRNGIYDIPANAAVYGRLPP